MATLIRPEISEKNKYWIDKNRYYELKHFCLQYPIWKSLYANFDNSDLPISLIDRFPQGNNISDPTAKRAIMRTYLSERIELIEKVAIETDPYLHTYLLKGITEGYSYTNLKTMHGMPCGKDMYYDRYRRFFWLLNNSRN